MTITHREPLLSEEERGLNSDLNIDDIELDDFLEKEQEEEETPENFAKDPFQPFNDLPEENRNILTFRAIAVGVFCGALVNASNIYLGLKSGWTSSANIFASIIGFTVLKSCAKHIKHIPLLGGDFGPRENNIVQTTATATGGMSGVFVSAFPAMYQLGLLDEPWKDFWRITTLTCVGGMFGFFFATPLRKFFIIYVARDLRLIFPSASATAITIRSLHLAAEGDHKSSTAQRKMKALSLAFVGSMGIRVASQYAIGLLWDWHIFTWLFQLGLPSNLVLGLESWGWFIEWTPAFIGSGMLVGLNVALSYLGGTVLAWGIIGPLLISYGSAFGTPASDDPKWSGLISYFSLTKEFTTADHPSPRYWLLWPGVLCMITISFTELGCQWRIFWHTGRSVWKGIRNVSSPIFKYKRIIETSEADKVEKTDLVEDPASLEESVKMWMWFPGLTLVLFLTCLFMYKQFDMPVSETCLALFLTFFFSFLAIQATGATDMTPLTAASKASQIILGASTKDLGWTIQRAQRINLLGGALASIGAGQAADLTSDFRVGFLLRTSPKHQWAAQGIGTLFAILLAPSTFVLFARAYPCINDVNALSCPFQVPSVSAWRAVAVAVTADALPIPRSSAIFSVVFAVVGSVMVLIRHSVWTGRWEWMRKWWPNMMVVALAFIVPATIYGTAMVIGAIVAAFWSKRNQKSFDTYGFAIAAGMMAGEGIGGVVNAVLQIVGLSGDVFGTTVGCPAGKC